MDHNSAPPKPRDFQSPFDYWTLRFVRDSAAILLFIAGPVLQIIYPRWLPIPLLSAVLLILAGHALTGFRYFPEGLIARYWRPSSWNTAAKAAVAFYYANVCWMALTLLWSPLPLLGAEDVAKIAIAPVFAFLLASELSRTVILKFSTIFAIGFLATCLVMILDHLGLTYVHQLRYPKNELIDLNRVAVFLSVLFWPLALLLHRRYRRPTVALLVGCVFILVLSLTKSEAAQLTFICSTIVVAVISFFPRLRTLIWTGAAILLFFIPYILNPIDDLTREFRSGLLPESAEHRVLIWKGYVDKVREHPLIGLGARSNRAIGNDAEVNAYADAKGYTGGSLHPHNATLELWIDYGALGILLIGGAFISTSLALRGNSKPEIVAATATMTAAFIYANTGSFMQSWWHSALTIAILSALIFSIGHEERRS